jgi:hypothetical protein
MKTTFFKQVLAAKQNRAQGAIFRLFAQWVIIFKMKEKIAGSGGIKGGSHECILHIFYATFRYCSKLHIFQM